MLINQKRAGLAPSAPVTFFARTFGLLLDRSASALAEALSEDSQRDPVALTRLCFHTAVLFLTLLKLLLQLGYCAAFSSLGLRSPFECQLLSAAELSSSGPKVTTGIRKKMAQSVLIFSGKGDEN